jgi:chromosomal replication initiation ATPase DnaA
MTTLSQFNALPADVRKVLTQTAELHNLEPFVLLIKCRKTHIKDCRFMAIKRLRQNGYSLKKIRTFFGYSCHSTIINAVQQCNNLIETNDAFRMQYLELMAKTNNLN